MFDKASSTMAAVAHTAASSCPEESVHEFCAAALPHFHSGHTSTDCSSQPIDPLSPTESDASHMKSLSHYINLHGHADLKDALTRLHVETRASMESNGGETESGQTMALEMLRKAHAEAEAVLTVTRPDKATWGPRDYVAFSVETRSALEKVRNGPEVLATLLRSPTADSRGSRRADRVRR